MSQINNAELVVRLRRQTRAAGCFPCDRCLEDARLAANELDRLQKIVDQANAAGFIDEKGEVRKVLTSATNTDRPVYATAMFIGETVVVLSSRGGA